MSEIAKVFIFVILIVVSVVSLMIEIYFVSNRDELDEKKYFLEKEVEINRRKISALEISLNVLRRDLEDAICEKNRLERELNELKKINSIEGGDEDAIR